MGILTWVVFGLIAGAIAKMLMPGKDPGGFFVTMFLGVAGAFVAEHDPGVYAYERGTPQEGV